MCCFHTNKSGVKPANALGFFIFSELFDPEMSDSRTVGAIVGQLPSDVRHLNVIILIILLTIAAFCARHILTTGGYFSSSGWVTIVVCSVV